MYNSYMTKPVFALFLDIDGVLFNRPDHEAVLKKAAELFPDRRISNRIDRIAASYFFDKTALQNLDQLIQKIEEKATVKIVISSNWRYKITVEELKTSIFGIHHFSKYIVDKTMDDLDDAKPFCRHPHHELDTIDCRASEIQHWLNAHPEVKNFAILDDVDDHLSDAFGERFIQTRYLTLLTDESFSKI